MKPINFPHFFLVIALLAGLTVGCGKSDDEAPADTYIPDLSAAGWANIADASDLLFFFNTPPAGSASGTFEGNRNGSADAGSFTGSFNHSSIQITFTSGNNEGRTFNGSINGSASPVVIKLTAPAFATLPAVTVQFKRS